ncbi:hypothetical protein OH76DRAFT_678423 [Lentinus brumalis]|uniref:N-acetyltransferase domain-containing protein n=1 Tax=Lentinus brumalis TaxID=2498619 RepID=A0A371D6N3_9APHY|nr:hypothetical protein OH76DRAFT_678423 [Polyporus brumalis]
MNPTRFPNRTKRRKVTQKGRRKRVDSQERDIPTQSFTLDPLIQALREQASEDWNDEWDIRDSFDAAMDTLLPELEDAERAFMSEHTLAVAQSSGLHLLSRKRAAQLAKLAEEENCTVLSSLLSVKARLHSRILRRVVLDRDPPYGRSGSLTPLRAPQPISSVNRQVLDALYAIQTTPYESSFLSRLQGYSPFRHTGVIAVDWETRTPWMELMDDIRDHYNFSHPEEDPAKEVVAPITYCTLQPCHLDQVHDLLARVFWEGIDVSDCLEHSPEKCTIVATYKQLVVGAAFLSSPQETYITYLAVRSGWDNSQIAKSMLYHLITRNPHKDITLHVSINNPAMLLYNRFGFKAEEFIVGFYEDYLDPKSPQSKNAFRLRLRRW